MSERVDINQDIVRAVGRVLPCVHMSTDFLAANAVTVFLKYLNYHKNNGGSIDDAIAGIKTISDE